MAQQAVHILEDGTIQQCHRFNKRFRSCELRPHWKTVEAAEIYLDNKAYLAERAAKVGEFTRTEKDFHHPKRLNASFPADRWNNSTVRAFGAQMDAYVAAHGDLPLNLWGVMSWQLHKPIGTYHTRIQMKTVMDPETLRTSRHWSVVSTLVQQFRSDSVLRDVELDFSHPRAAAESLEALREVFSCVVTLTSPGIRWEEPNARPKEDVVGAMMGRFQDMYNAIEGAMRRSMDAQGDEIGDFTDSTEDKIVVDVEYDRSLFGARSFKSFFRENLYFNNPATVDADIRVTDCRRRGRGETFWSLYRKDGVWSVVAATEEATSDNLTPTAEDVRSHVYWHVIREINPDDQEQAFAKSQYAADLFTMVEEELALFQAGAPQPR